MRVALISCTDMPEPDPDREVLAAGLAAAGVDARWIAWNGGDAGQAWASFDLAVLRATWDYHLAVDRFLGWVDAVSAVTTVLNPPDVVRANAHKGYLNELAARGVPTVPTALVHPGRTEELADLAAARGWRDVVVKPAVSAGSHLTLRVAANDPSGQGHLATVLATSDALVQPYLAGVEGDGERALVWIDGAFTHAVRKAPRFLGDDESVTGPLPIADDERAVATAALAPVASRLLYARVDLCRDDAGQPRVMELELIEPSLFLLQHPPALERLVAAIARRAAAGG
ncbi:MAG: hypothetical protein CVU56_12405 [Deltaproteobacteria bacterium HGW-Deltaproteobacteria-14]|jgi:glutathione synthase/RimK-type ligase-like ATP-grasp enzyme|nr:MAG: hypothetical protein CVU56_12405 [Deltaproteobacteria bacterium HGW-Deltaproteobacteria-14]